MEDETAESPEEMLLKQHRKEKKDLQGILRQVASAAKRVYFISLPIEQEVGNTYYPMSRYRFPLRFRKWVLFFLIYINILRCQ